MKSAPRQAEILGRSTFQVLVDFFDFRSRFLRHVLPLPVAPLRMTRTKQMKKRKSVDVSRLPGGEGVDDEDVLMAIADGE